MRREIPCARVIGSLRRFAEASADSVAEEIVDHMQ